MASIKLLIHLVYLFQLILLTSSFNVVYKPFHPGFNNTCDNPAQESETFLNSIYGTGNRLKDVTYKALCVSVCNKIQHEEDVCCESKDLNDIKCMSPHYCKSLKYKLDSFFYEILFTTYFSLLTITIVIMFLIFYFLSLKNAKNTENSESPLTRKQCFINGLVAALLVLLTGLVIPIIILKLICVVKKISMTRILGGDFRRISSTKLVFSLEIKNEERKKRYIILDEIGHENYCQSNIHSKNTEGAMDTGKKLKIFDENDIVSAIRL